MALGIVNANTVFPSSPLSLPQAVKVGFLFCRCICLAENNVPGGYNFAGLLARMFDEWLVTTTDMAVLLSEL